MKFLIATTNKEKLKIVSLMLAPLVEHKISIVSLNDISAQIDGSESGGLADRAKQKIDDVLASLHDVSEFDVIVGVDDGIRVPGATIDPNVKNFYENLKKDESQIVIGDTIEIC